MIVKAKAEVRCPKCGNSPDLETLTAQVRLQRLFKCTQCGRVSPMHEAVKLIEVIGAE